MLSYYSSISGIGGVLKQKAEDFIVEEILPDGRVLELNTPVNLDGTGNFLHFVLQKKNWSTASAIKEISRKLRISHRNFSQAGNKDKSAITTQLLSVYGTKKEHLDSLKIKDIQINGCWYSEDKLHLGQLLGNRFTISVSDIRSKSPEKEVNSIYKDLDAKFPNYFGEQRFGSTRSNTARIGLLLLRNQFEEAAMEFLANSEGEINEQAKLARKSLSDSKDFSKAIKEFPKYLHLELSMLDYLSKNPNNFVGAFRKLPRTTLLLFVHAVQSLLFNQLVSERISEKSYKPEEGEYLCAEKRPGFPDISNSTTTGWLAVKLIGYESKPNEREKKVLREFNIQVDDFKLRSIPEVGSKGNYRTMFAPLNDFSFKNNTFKFTLPSGCYATTALREFLDQKSR